MRHIALTNNRQSSSQLLGSARRWRLLDKTGHHRGLGAELLLTKQGGMEGWREEGSEEREDMTGLHSRADTPYDDVEWERKLLLYP